MSEANDAAKAALNDIKTDEGTQIPVSDGSDNYTDIEAEAAKHGWSPEGVEGKRNLSAEEFMDRQPLYDDIRNLKKQTRKLQDGLEASLKMQEGIRKREREKTIAELTDAKREALEQQDFDQVIKLDEDLNSVRNEPIETPANNQDFEEWSENNEWYHSNTEMRHFADVVGAGLYSQNPKTPMKEIYKLVEAETKKHFPDEFGGNANRRRQSAVEGAGQGRQNSAGGGKPTRYTRADLPEEDRVIMDTIRRAHPKMSEQDYLKQYFS